MKVNIVNTILFEQYLCIVSNLRTQPVIITIHHARAPKTETAILRETPMWKIRILFFTTMPQSNTKTHGRKEAKREKLGGKFSKESTT